MLQHNISYKVAECWADHQLHIVVVVAQSTTIECVVPLHFGNGVLHEIVVVLSDVYVCAKGWQPFATCRHCSVECAWLTVRLVLLQWHTHYCSMCVSMYNMLNLLTTCNIILSCVRGCMSATINYYRYSRRCDWVVQCIEGQASLLMCVCTPHTQCMCECTIMCVQLQLVCISSARDVRASYIHNGATWCGPLNYIITSIRVTAACRFSLHI